MDWTSGLDWCTGLMHTNFFRQMASQLSHCMVVLCILPGWSSIIAVHKDITFSFNPNLSSKDINVDNM